MSVCMYVLLIVFFFFFDVNKKKYCRVLSLVCCELTPPGFQYKTGQRVPLDLILISIFTGTSFIPLA